MSVAARTVTRMSRIPLDWLGACVSVRRRPSRGMGARACMFASIEDVIERFGKLQYIASRTIGTVVYLASHLKKPILVEGPAGVGKTELAKVVAQALGHELIRLQCYEGLDEAKALYEWEYAKQLLYTQILKDKISEVLGGARSLREAVDKIASEDDVFFSDRFILPRPLLRAITAEEPCVLLIDEVDKSDTEFEAFLLEVLSDFQVSVPELGTLHARHIPTVVLTSNNAREMSDALKRRCLHLFIDFPERAQELEIVRLKVPGVSERLAAEVVSVVHRVRKLDLKKAPSISETLDWARALTLLNVKTLDEQLVSETLSTILKYEGDIRKAQQELKEYVELQRAKLKAPARRATRTCCIKRPETLSRVGNGPREWRPMKMASVVPRPAKPARQTFRNRLRSPATPSLQSAPTNCFVAPAPPTFAAPALPVAARHSNY